MAQAQDAQLLSLSPSPPFPCDSHLKHEAVAGAQDTLTPHLDSGPGRRCPPRARCSGSCTQRW